MKTLVKCPNCHSSFQLDELLINEFRDSIRLEFESELINREAELSEKLEIARQEIREQVQQESNLTIKTKEKLISDLKDQLTKVRQKLENSSQQMTGEIQELALEAILSSTFPTDLIEPVAKGRNGADCTQFIRSKSGASIGTILYESKRVATFSPGWIDKLKKDNLTAKCDITVIVTSAMPKDITGKFGVKDGVWICVFEPEAIKQLALVLRFGLCKIAELRITQTSGDEKIEKLVRYLSSNEYHNQVENVLKGFKILEHSFQEEKTKLTKMWKLREQQLQDTLASTLEVLDSIGSISGRGIDQIAMPGYRQAS
jgi:hypothetical protein